jgi:hypothetical protein
MAIAPAITGGEQIKSREQVPTGSAAKGKPSAVQVGTHNEQGSNETCHEHGNERIHDIGRLL